MASALLPLERSLSVARRRMMVHSILNRLALVWGVALAAGLGWFMAEPWLVEAPPAWLRWSVLGALAGVATIIAIVWTIRTAPSRRDIALEIDLRFSLRERLTTALGLSDQELNSPAGQAVLADATEKITGLPVGTKFPVRLAWHSSMVPVLAACLALVAFFYQPNVGQATEEDNASPEQKLDDPASIAMQQKKAITPFTKQNKPPELANRKDKSEKLKELEAELNEMMRKYDLDANRETPEKLRDKAADITAMEEKIKDFKKEEAAKLEKLEEQLQQLDRLNDDPDFRDGPAKALNDALSKGDLKKAQDEVDMLKKKAKDKNLSKEDQQKLSKQLEKMKEQVERLQRNKEREEKLKELIEKAKEEGRDAESLERELEKIQQEQKEVSEAAQNLAKSFERARQALQEGDLEKVAEELENAGQSLEEIEGELKDLEDAQEYLQRLKAEREAACKKCQGQGKDGNELGNKDDAEWSPFTNPATGRRPENKDAKTSSEDERIRGLFDPTKKKTYGGATTGPAFTKSTTSELGPIIQEAAQQAPQAVDIQRHSRDAKETVKEYFQNLGGHAPGGK
jgi:uncharacterized coiled-coil DUF342 family protein